MTSKLDKKYTEITIAVPWGHVSGRWYGDQRVRPILALHGWMDNCGSFAKLAPLLVPYASILCIDLPGHGYSSHLPTGIIYHIMEYVRLIYVLMKTYQWQKVSLLGHSMGGGVAFNFAGIHPERVDVVITLDVISGQYYGVTQMPLVVAHQLENALIENERILNRSPMNEPPTYSFAECEKLLHEGSGYSVELDNCKYILERNITKSVSYPDKYYFSRDRRVKYIVETNRSPEMSKALGMHVCKAAIPFCVIYGGATRNPSSMQTDVADIFAQYNPNYERHVVPNATHHLHLNNPVEVANKIITFLNKYRSPACIHAELDNRNYDKAKL